MCHQPYDIIKPSMRVNHTPNLRIFPLELSLTIARLPRRTSAAHTNKRSALALGFSVGLHMSSFMSSQNTPHTLPMMHLLLRQMFER